MVRILFLILVGMSLVAFGQTNQNEVCPPNSQICDPRPNAAKFDEFAVITAKDFKKRFNLYFAELQKNPNDQGYIINYGSETEVAKREKLVRESVDFLKLDANRMTIVRGGESKIPKTEFWIVPVGADNPEPDYDNSKQMERPQKRTFTRYRLEKFGEVSDRFFKITFNEFFEIVKQRQTVKGYIVMHGTASEIAAFENRIKGLEFFEFYNSDRIIFLKKIENPAQATISLWIVPQDEEFSEEIDKK